MVGAVAIGSLLAGVIAAVRWATGEPPFSTAAAAGYTIAAGLAEAVYFSTLARALTAGPLGAVYTVSRGGAVLVVWPLSIVWFGESVTWSSGTGSAIVLGGLVVSGLGAEVSSSGARSGVAWAAVCAVSIAGYHLAYKAALSTGGNPSATFALSLGLAAAISAVRLGRPGRRALGQLLRHRTLRIGLMGAACGGSFLILMEALARGGSGYVLTLRNTSVLFATGFALAIGERPGRSDWIGAALVAGGAVLMSL